MEYAIQLAQMVKGQTGINPPVGAVVVNNGRIVGLGFDLAKFFLVFKMRLFRFEVMLF